MAEEQNVEIVKSLFEAFGRGDFPAAIRLMSEDIDSKSPVTHTTHTTLTWARPRRGFQEVMQFFYEMATMVAPEPFEVLNIIAQGDLVAVEGRNKGIVRSTGKKFEHDWVMVFSLESGKITRCYHYYDSADILAAF